MTKLKAEKLLRDAGRPWEIAVGFASGLIGVAFLGLFVWFTYVVAWRNPREYDVHVFWRPETIAILGLFLVIALCFILISFRLLARPSRGWLFSPMSLRISGAFFGVAGLPVFSTTVRRDDWITNYHAWALLTTSITMAVAAFMLARRREKNLARYRGDLQVEASPRGVVKLVQQPGLDTHEPD